jgi:hypothetical protein
MDWLFLAHGSQIIRTHDAIYISTGDGYWAKSIYLRWANVQAVRHQLICGFAKFLVLGGQPYSKERLFQRLSFHETGNGAGFPVS